MYFLSSGVEKRSLKEATCFSSGHSNLSSIIGFLLNLAILCNSLSAFSNFVLTKYQRIDSGYILSTNTVREGHLLYINIYKISCVLRTLWLVSYRINIRLCKHGSDVTACFPFLFYKRNRKWMPCVYITWCKHSREFGRFWRYLCKPSSATWVHKNFQIVPNSLSRVWMLRLYKRTGGHFLFLKYIYI